MFATIDWTRRIKESYPSSAGERLCSVKRGINGDQSTCLDGVALESDVSQSPLDPSGEVPPLRRRLRRRFFLGPSDPEVELPGSAGPAEDPSL